LLTRCLLLTIGKILGIGADWSYTDARGSYQPDMRAHLLTLDGGSIYLQTTGLTQKDGLVHVRTTFETGNSGYAWLNSVVGIGIMRGTSTGFRIDMWQMTSPGA
jgi:hypothetical protein